MVSSRFFALLTVIFAAIIGIVLVIAQRQPIPPDPSLITRPRCGVPCTFGIVPGETERRVAQATIERATNGIYDLMSNRGLSFTLPDALGRTVAGSITFDFMGAQRVGSISLFQSTTGADIGQLSDLILAGYTPNRVLRSCEGSTPRMLGMTFGYDDRMSATFVVRDGITPDLQISIMEIRAPNIDFDTALANIDCEVETRWYGFAPLWKYFPTSR